MYVFILFRSVPTYSRFVSTMSSRLPIFMLMSHYSQNFPFDQWSNISPSPSHFRSGSMSSGLNSSHLDLSDDIHLNLSSRQRQPQQQQFTMNRNGNLGARNMSTSVFNLSQPNRKPLENNSNWMNSQVQQVKILQIYS